MVLVHTKGSTALVSLRIDKSCKQVAGEGTTVLMPGPRTLQLLPALPAGVQPALKHAMAVGALVAALADALHTQRQ